MRWISRSEKEILKQWSKEFASENITKEIFKEIDDKLESYWSECNQQNDIEEYDFSTISQINEILQNNLREEYFDDIILPVSIAIFKGKNNIMKTDEKNEKETVGFNISEFVYEF